MKVVYGGRALVVEPQTLGAASVAPGRRAPFVFVTPFGWAPILISSRRPFLVAADFAGASAAVRLESSGSTCPA